MQAISAARAFFGDCSDCLDKACAAKIRNLAFVPADILPGKPLGNSLFEVASDIAVANADLERDHATGRQVLRSITRLVQLSESVDVRWSIRFS